MFGEEKRIQCSDLDQMSVSPTLDAIGVLPRLLCQEGA